MPDGLLSFCAAVAAAILCLAYFRRWKPLRRRFMDIWTAAFIGIALAVVLALLLWE